MRYRMTRSDGTAMDALMRPQPHADATLAVCPTGFHLLVHAQRADLGWAPFKNRLHGPREGLPCPPKGSSHSRSLACFGGRSGAAVSDGLSVSEKNPGGRASHERPSNLFSLGPGGQQLLPPPYKGADTLRIAGRGSSEASLVSGRGNERFT
ncbi:hypothetical protein HPB47_023842 [Ixodes persulcatus]|uniref:Uncharacterized protein n=1 Tax=Ixodes persulcatus TaxID=34615 RepID=A0AC60Q5X1_IXOPE|nr:hypothetical protein HPB47_023842 [Ixodes persulcatus]